jgi:hypothetical protein
MRSFAFLLGTVFLAHALSAQEPEPARDHVVVYVKVEELDSVIEGKTKVLAELEPKVRLGKPITFNSGEEVPLKIPLGDGLELIDYVPNGIRLELTCERIVGDSVWVNLVIESVRVVDGKDGLFTTESNNVRKRGKLKLGKTLRTEPIRVDPEKNQHIRLEFRIENANANDPVRPGQR